MGSTDVHEEAVDEAETGVAVLLDYTVVETSDLMSEHTALSELSHDAITQAFVNDLRGFTSSSPQPGEKRGVYDIAQSDDGRVTFSVFFGSSVFRSGGLVTTNVSRHSCGTITGRFSERDLSVQDASCPPDITTWAGEESAAVSLTKMQAKYEETTG